MIKHQLRLASLHRPPTDPVNAMLSLAYTMLTRLLTIALTTVGLNFSMRRVAANQLSLSTLWSRSVQSLPIR